MQNGQRVLIVGATGKLGRAITKELKRRDYWIRVLIRETSIRADEMAGERIAVSAGLAKCS
jgi:nucleoside-diphosphate-sugar epimerase